MNKIFFLFFIYFIVNQNIISQSNDSTQIHQTYIPEIQIVGKASPNDYQQLPEVVGTTIYAGKKNSLILMDNVLGNKANNTMRQVLAKVPGIHIWESDGSGIQIGIASRGLSPNRSWEFNIRQNGYDIAADPYGYPEAYYNPQLQAVQKIEIVRGQASLQYGPQIGGMINYIMKDGSNITKPFQLESEQTIGSNGMINSYNAIGGNTKKLNYYAFYDHRSAEGYRANSQYNTNTFFGTLSYKFSDQTILKAEATRWNMQSQQPGGLTDAELYIDPKKSYRARNWFQLDWSIASVMFQHSWNEKNRVQLKAFIMQGDRNSIGYNPSNGISVKDTLNVALNSLNPRTIDSDRYTNKGVEAKWLSDFNLFNKTNTVSVGLRWYNGSTDRQRGGKEDGAGSSFTLARDIHIPWSGIIDYQTQNHAAFTENIFRINKKFIIIPGVRIENLRGNAAGYNGLKDNNPIVLVPRSKNRTFILAGVAAEYHMKNLEWYANINQAYRPIQFADLTTPPTTDELDPAIQDSRAVNIDLGIRGFVVNGLRVDVGVYNLEYTNRIGTLRQQRADGSFYNFRTNIGSSSSYGIESLVEWNINKSVKENPKSEWIPYISYAYNHATYDQLKIATQSGNQLVEKIISGNKVENAPAHIIRTGIEWRNLLWRWQVTYAYTSSMFSDATNTILPTTNGQNGLIPSYQLVDLSGQYKLNKYIMFKAGINNVLNQFYFTRRASGYPGPGALPSDGRTAWLSIAFKF